jgi:hypothetical protein
MHRISALVLFALAIFHWRDLVDEETAPERDAVGAP